MLHSIDHDDRGLLNAAMQKRLQNRLKQLQLPVIKDGSSNSFSTFCDGVKFVPFASHHQSEQCIFQRPLLHTFWNATSDVEEYRVRTKPQIVQWLADVEKLGGYATCVVVFCITAEVRAAKKKVKGQGDVEDKLRNDFKGKVILAFRLASSDETRLADSFQSFTNTLNDMCFSCMEQLIAVEVKCLSTLKQSGVPLQDTYNYLVRLINLAVAYEMILLDNNALECFNEANYMLEVTLSRLATTNESVGWLDRIASNPCTSWDYPTLIETNHSWKYLPAIQDGSSPLLHIHTFLLSRQARLLFSLGKGWSVSQTCISTLHAMSREKRELKVLQTMPIGAVESWAYMTCFEVILAIMTQSNPDSLMSAATSSLHVRAEMWHYALEKLRTLGLLCGLMPKDSFKTEIIKAIQSGITKHPESSEFEDEDQFTNMCTLLLLFLYGYLSGYKEHSTEDHGRNLIGFLQSQQAFKANYLTLGEMVIGAYKHAGRKRMAFRVGSMMAEFHKDLGLWVEAEQLLSDVCNYYSEDQWSHLFIKAYSLLAECQNQLKMEDKYVSTMVLLASIPASNIISHDPAKWMDKIMQVANKSVYQKLLNWEPMIVLEKIIVNDSNTVYNINDDIIVEVQLKYNGPTQMKLNIASMTYSATSSTLIRQTSPSASSTSARLELEELNLDASTDTSLRSRPIGMSHKRYRSLDTGRSADSKQKVIEFYLSKRQVMLQRGRNKIVLSGKATVLGQYTSTKISLKCGSLDFMLPLTDDDNTSTISITPCEPGVSFTLSSDIGVFLAGYPLNCTATFQAGAGTTIPLKSKASVIFIGACEVKIPESCTVTNNKNQTEVLVELPEVLPCAKFSIPLTICVPSACCSTEDPLNKVQAYCNSVFIRSLQINLEQPFDILCSEHAGGESTYLLLNIINKCSVPLELKSFDISSAMALVCLHNHLSAVLHPQNTLSNIWQCCADETSSPALSCCSFSFRPMIPGKVTEDWTIKHQICLSSLQIEYELSVQSSPGDDSSSYVANSDLLLKYDIKGVFSKKRAETLQYKIVVDKALWKIGDSEVGTVAAPNLGQTISVTIKAVPKISGFLSIPNMVLNCGNPLTELTEAQVYNLSMGEVIKIA